MRSLLVGITIGLIASTLFVGGFATGTLIERARSPVSSDRDLSDFLTAYRLVTKHSYYRSLNHRRLINAAINGMFSATGDPHTLFLSPNQNQETSRALNGSQYAGIGAIVVPVGSNLRIVTPLPHSPAASAGLRAGDLVTGINGVSVATMTGDSAIARIHGRAGSLVRLSLIRGQHQRLSVDVRRAIIPAVTAYGRSLGHRLAYIDIFSFGAGTPRDVASALRASTSSRALALVIDLRGNPGGYVESAQQIVSMFVDHGTVAYEKTASGAVHALPVITGRRLTRLPVVVLADGGTASAAEITAAALQDDDHAVVVGTRTYGKGSMQSVYTLPDGSSVRITDRLWLTPRKRSIDGKGITPDISVPSADAATASGDDPQLDAAERYLERHLAP